MLYELTKEHLTDDDLKVVKHMRAINKLFRKGNLTVTSLFVDNGTMKLVKNIGDTDYTVESYYDITCDGAIQTGTDNGDSTTRTSSKSTMRTNKTHNMDTNGHKRNQRPHLNTFNMKEYLYNEWRNGVSPKYLHLFDEWFGNLTDTQKLYFSAYAEGHKTPWQGQN